MMMRNHPPKKRGKTNHSGYIPGVKNPPPLPELKNPPPPPSPPKKRSRHVVNGLNFEKK